MNPGIYRGMSRADYDAIDAVNISRLLTGRYAMEDLKWADDHPREQSDDLLIGCALHVAVFEPAEFSKRVVVWSGTRKGKAWDSFNEANRQFIILRETETVDQMALVVRMRDKLNAFPPMRKLLDSKGDGEVAFVWRDSETGLLCKGLIDRLCEWNRWQTLVDLKTCQDASKDGFSRAIGEHGYHIRAAWYLDGLEAIEPTKHGRRFFYIPIEKKEPHKCAWYDAHDDDDATINEGRRVYRRLLNQFAECKKTGIWPGYPFGDSPEPVSLPKWGFEK